MEKEMAAHHSARGDGRRQKADGRWQMAGAEGGFDVGISWGRKTRRRDNDTCRAAS